MVTRAQLAVACGAVVILLANAADAAVPDVPVDLNVTAVSGTSASFSWTGTAPEFRVIYKAGIPPINPNDGTLVFQGPTAVTPPNTAALAGLAVNTRYFIAVYGKASGSATYSTSALTTSILTTGTARIATTGAAPPWDRRGSPTRLGKFIFATSGGDLDWFDGSVVQPLQPKGALTGDPNTVFALGTEDPTHVTAGWRRGTDDAYLAFNIPNDPVVAINATNPINAATPMNCEFITIDSGRVFAVFRAPLGGSEVRNAFSVDFNGNATNITNNTTVYGVVHLSSSGNQAAWAFDDGTGNIKLQYYDLDGDPAPHVVTVDSNIVGDPNVSHGRIVYAKTVAPGRAEIFVYDTNVPSPSPVQLTNNATYTNETPFTDGRHVAWIRRNASDNLDPEIILGGIQITNNNFALLDNTVDPPFDLDRGQMAWRDNTGVIHQLTSTSEATVDPSTSANRSIPWFADGRLLFYDSSTAPANIYFFNGQLPNDSQQPSPPMTLRATATSSTSVTLQWDTILGASYNIYYATQPGVTKANYSSLSHGARITGISQTSQSVTGLYPNTPYYFFVTAVSGATEGPESRTASVALIASPSWTSVGSLSGINMATVAIDRSIPNVAYAAGGNGVAGPFNTYTSTDNGLTWTTLADPAIVGQNVRAIAADNTHVFASTRSGPIYRSLDSGGHWTNVVTATSGSATQAIAMDPAVPITIVAGGNFVLPSYSGSANDSDVIRSDDAGATWFHTPQAPSGGSLATYALAFDPSHTSTLFSAGNGTPNVARSIAGGAGWSDVTPASGYVYAVAVDPGNTRTIYAGFQQSFGGHDNRGVWKSVNGGTNWTQTGLQGIAVRALVVDPADSNVLHAGTESGYYASVDGGANWTQINAGLSGVDAQFINALAMVGNHRLIAATNDGLYLLDLAAALTILNPPPSVTATTISVAGPQAQVYVSFCCVDDATTYDVYRRSRGSDPFALVGSTASIPYYDTVDILAAAPAPPGTIATYQYAIVGKNATSSSNLAASPRDIATAMVFDSDPLAFEATPIKFLHLDELRKGTNAVRYFAGLTPFSFVNGGAAGTRIDATQLSEVRSALDPAIALIGFTPPPYTDSTLNNTVKIKVSHFQELRDRIK